MKTKFLQRVLWLMIPLLTIFTTNAWGAGAVSISTAIKIFPKKSTTVSQNDWGSSGAPSVYSTTATDYTIDSNGSFTFYNAADYNNSTTNFLQLKASGGYIQTAITSPAGVDVYIGYKTGGANNLTISLTGAAANVNVNSSSSYKTTKISTTSTTATLKIHKNTAQVAYISFIVIVPKIPNSSGDYVLVENVGDIGPGQYLIVYNNTNALNTHYGNVHDNTYGTYTAISSYYNSSTKSITSNATTDALAFDVITSRNGYCIRKTSEGTFLGNSSNSTGSYLRWDTTYTSSQNEWTLGVNSIVSARNASYAIRYNSGSPRFAIYGPTGQQAVQLFKKVEAPSCDAPTAVTKGSFNRTNQKMEIGWTGATNVDICYSKSTTKPASPQVTNTSTNPYAIDVSDYSATDKCYVWVRQNCGGGETSAWVAINVSGNAYFNLPSHTLAITPSPASSGTFSPTSGQTVVEGRTVSITATPAAGYVFSSWAVSGTNASLSSTTTNPTTFTMGTANATVTATFTAKPLVSISLSPASGTVYVGQYADFTVAYDPSDYLSKGYTLVATPTYVTKIAQAPAQTLLRLQGGRSSGPGASITTDQTETISIQASGDNTKTASVSITVKPLPKVHFVDIVHGYAFDDVVGTIEDNVLVSNKTTPTHAEYSGTGANDCETNHTRLVGWIEKTWADEHPNATHEDIIDAGTGVFIEANTAINVLTYNGNTYYAVWAKLQ